MSVMLMSHIGQCLNIEQFLFRQGLPTGGAGGGAGSLDMLRNSPQVLSLLYGTILVGDEISEQATCGTIINHQNKFSIFFLKVNKHQY